jgi:hypothetical protein
MERVDATCRIRLTMIAGASVCRLDHDFLAPKATSNVCRINMCALAGRIVLISRPVVPSGLPTGFWRWFCGRNCGCVAETVAGGFLKVQQANSASC